MSAMQVQILANRFAALAREGAEAFVRMARSPIAIDEGQYACAILDGDARLIAQVQGEPSQLAAAQATVAFIVDRFAFDLAEGDVVLTGDPYCGGTVGGTLTLSVPVFEDGELRYFVAIRFASADLAGDVPGCYQPEAFQIWAESVRITPVKLVKAGALQKDIRRYLMTNTRAPEMLAGDLKAAIVAAQTIGGRLENLVAERGFAILDQAASHRIDYAAARMASHLQSLEKGGAGEMTSIDTTATVKVRLERSDNGFVVDFTGTSPAGESAAYLTPAATHAAVLVQLAAEIIDDVGVSQGMLDSVTLLLPENCCVNPKFPAAVSMGWRQVAPAVSAALAQAGRTRTAINPAPAMVMLFEEIGSTSTMIPTVLSPGFCAAPDTTGGDAAFGCRKLVSAEQAEVAGTVRLMYREFSEGGIRAEVAVERAGFEAIVVPGSTQNPQIEQETPLDNEYSNVLSVAQGARIKFFYPMREVTLHDA